LLIAIIAFTILKVLIVTNSVGAIPEGIREPVILFLDFLLTMNISLAVFNLLPFPPLDGSKILDTFLPESLKPGLAALEQYGFLLLMILMYMGFFSAIINPVLRLVYSLLLR
jgi:Zn-dependent protease